MADSLPPYRVIFGQNLRIARKSMGLTQEGLADLSGIHRSYIGAVERGEQNITVDNMQRLAEVVGCSLIDMLKEPTPVSVDP